MTRERPGPPRGARRRRTPARSLTTRVALATLAAGGIALAVSMAAAVVLVQREDEARLVELALTTAAGARRDVEHAVARTRAELALLAAEETHEALETSGELHPGVVAVRVTRGGRPVLDLAEQHGLAARFAASLDGVPRAPLVVGERHLAVGAERRGGAAVALLDVPRIVHLPAGWRMALAPAAEAEVPGATRVTRGVDGGVERARASAVSPLGFELRVEAPLAPARSAALAFTWRLLAWSSLGLLPLLALGVALARTQTGPLRRLAAAVRAAGAGPVALPPMPDDELGELAAAIDERSRRVAEDARVLRTAVRFTRRLGGARVASDALTMLAEALEASFPAARWEVVPLALGDTAELATALGVARDAVQRALARTAIDVSADPRVSVLPPAGGAAALAREGDGTLVVPLRTLGQDFGAVVGRDLPDDGPLAMVELMCGATLVQLRRIELRARVFAHEKRSLVGTVVAALGQRMHAPVSVLAANLHALEGALRDDPGDIVAEASAATQRLLNDVRHIAAFARRASPTSIERLDVVAVLRDVASIAVAHQPGVPVDVHVLEPLRAYGDPFALEQALRCLVENAQDAVVLRGVGAVRVTGRVEGLQIAVEVADDGPGVDRDVQRMLFEPFVTTKRGDGTGLGLFLARSFARSLGGDVTLARTGRDGSVFRLTLPSDLGPAETAPTSEELRP